MRGLMMDRPLLISDLIEFGARYGGDAEIVTRLVEGGIHRETYREARARIKKLANALLAAGVKPGDRLATIAWNTHRHFELYFAVSGIGAVLHTINPRLGLDELLYVVNHAEDTHLFYDTTFHKLAAALAASKTGVKTWVALTDDAHLPADGAVPGVVSYESLLTGHSDQLEWPVFDENTASSLCYTSGTTGQPKGVLYSHRSTRLHTYAVSGLDGLGVGAREVLLPVVPMFHVNAWGIPYAAAGAGAKLVLPGPGMDGKSVAELIETEGVTCALGVPTIWLALAEHMRKEQRKFPANLRLVVGGAALPASLQRTLEEELGADTIHAWGMTEMSPLGTCSHLLPKYDHLGTEEQRAAKLKQGRPVIGVDLRLVDEEGKELPFDGVASGHLQVRGPWITAGYFKEPGVAAITDGWFDTGDVATIDADGAMEITDRAKDIVKSGGEWISSVKLENAAMGCPGVANAAVIGIAHPKWQERPLLIIVARPGTPPTAADIRAHLATQVPSWWLPDAVEFVDSLPVGGTGKISKRTLRERFAGYQLPEKDA
jgi:acyl-CoA synthetase (AMP-forming)/AMP-acid ligase II